MKHFNILAWYGLLGTRHGSGKPGARPPIPIGKHDTNVANLMSSRAKKYNKVPGCSSAFITVTFIFLSTRPTRASTLETRHVGEI